VADPYAGAHAQLLTLGLEVLGVLALATVAAQPGWGGPALVLLLILWTLFLFAHSGALRGALDIPLAGTPGLKLNPGTAGQ
jgi:hypothetical protein